MLDHTGFVVTDLKAARRFYDAIAEALGLGTVDINDQAFVLGNSAEQPVPSLWIGTMVPSYWPEGARPDQNPMHVAFTADSKDRVKAFHAAGLKAGGRDNGAPGPREESRYYGAFVIDPDGNNIEAVYRGPDALEA